MNYYYIPTNYTDIGKFLGFFDIRNTVEAVILALPLLYLSFILVPFGLTWKIIIGMTFAVPIGGFALIGINDDCLSRFVKAWWNWYRNRKILLYRGDASDEF